VHAGAAAEHVPHGVEQLGRDAGFAEVRFELMRLAAGCVETIGQ
jgi:hypothetical protein